jgi:hypothetical protein
MREAEEAARLLSALDPKRLLANLHAAALTRSSQAFKALAADVHELELVFQRLNNAGFDVSTAYQDFQLFKQFVSQCRGTAVESKSDHNRRGSTGSLKPSLTQHSLSTRRLSAPSQAKHVHFASHATVYTLPPKQLQPVFTPPARPSCLPRTNRYD